MEALMSLVQWCSMMALLSATTGPTTTPARPERGSVEISAGPFSLSVKPSELSAEIGREWTGKRWLDDFASYVNSSPTRSHVVGRSRQVAFSYEEAQQLAAIDAARQMYDRMRGRLHPRLSQTDRTRIVQGIAQELTGGKGLLDYHSTRGHRYGEEVWTHAVLVDASDRRLASMADRYNGMVRERRANFAQTAASVAGLLVLICVTYGLVNAWTKGYVRGRLRAGAVLGMVAGVWVLIRLADLAP